MDKEPVCGAMVTNENWMDAKYMLKIKATLDNKIDGDQERGLNVSVDYMVNGMTEQSNINKKYMKVFPWLLKKCLISSF